MLKKLFLLLILCHLSFTAFAENTQEWELVTAEDPITYERVCLMVSTTKKMEDGHGKTPITIFYNGESFIIKTKSNIDMSYEKSGIKVDSASTLYSIDKVHRETKAIFKTQAPAMLDAFLNGKQAHILLGFWPTWPKTKLHHIQFDLSYFAEIYPSFLHCKKNW